MTMTEVVETVLEPYLRGHGFNSQSCCKQLRVSCQCTVCSGQLSLLPSLHLKCGLWAKGLEWFNGLVLCL